MPSVGVVIPTLNEARRLPHLLDDLALVAVPLEVVVADGGSTDGTPAVARAAGTRTVAMRRGRASQLNAGAEALTTDWLLFLHADVRLPARARHQLVTTVRDPTAVAAVWRLAVDARGWWFRVIELGAWLRDRLGGLPYGDQGLLIRRALFEALGGYPDLPLMEDVELVRRVRKRAALRRLPAPVLTSARRYRREGAFRGWVRNAVLVTLYLAGVSPHRLVRWYRPEPT